MFAIGVYGFNITDKNEKRYFDLKMSTNMIVNSIKYKNSFPL
jgi:hypothetical protein